ARRLVTDLRQERCHPLRGADAVRSAGVGQGLGPLGGDGGAAADRLLDCRGGQDHGESGNKKHRLGGRG
ncbi:hypothetical protein, partial [Pseudomonas syringae group genomosp. 7]|uniref:hypothetical protein n=1 Tax=Pseudomonas syringae group genomosp. 7 TaxID=251699 RepID=UPI0037704086